MSKSLLEREVIKDGSGAEHQAIKAVGFSWVDSLLANKVQMHFLHVAHASLHFPTQLLQHLLRAEVVLERLLSEEGRKQPLECRKLGPVMIQIGPGGLEGGREEQKARASPVKHASSRAASSFPMACVVLVVAAGGLCSRSSPSVVSLLGSSDLVRETFLGVLGENSRLVLFEAVTWASADPREMRAAQELSGAGETPRAQNRGAGKSFSFLLYHAA